MIIIAGHSRTRNAIERDPAVAAFANMVERARKQDGCLDLSICADPVDAERINVFECWRDQQALGAWRKIARGPKVAIRETKRKAVPHRQGREAILRRGAIRFEEIGE